MAIGADQGMDRIGSMAHGGIALVLTVVLALIPSLPVRAMAQTTGAPATQVPSQIAPGTASVIPTTFATDAKQVLLVEEETGTILFERNSAARFTSASLAKLMTVEVVLAALRAGQVTENQAFPVSEYAWRTGGAPSRTASMFAALGSRVAVRDLLRGVMVQMANDACLVLAEGVAGSEAAFVARMNARARELGLGDSQFANATGLPDPGNKVSARDMLRLIGHLRVTYPDLYRLYGETSFAWNRIDQRNRNPLLGRVSGLDGGVAGFAEEDGYSLVASAEQNGTRLTLVLAGSDSDKKRVEDATKAFAWGFGSFEKRSLFAAGQPIASASVYGGEPSAVSLVAPQPVEVYLPIGAADRVETRVTYRWPIRPVVEKGDVIARLTVRLGEKDLRSFPLQAAERVGQGGLLKRVCDALVELVFFWV